MISGENVVLLQLSFLAQRLRSVVAEWVVVNFNLASLELLGSELATVASLVHLLVRRAVVGVRTAAVTIGGRRSLSVHVDAAQGLGTLGVEPVTKVAAHALGLRRSDVSVVAVAVSSLGARTIELGLRSSTSKALAVTASVGVVGERSSEALSGGLDAVLLGSDNPGREAGYATIELLDLGLDAAAVRGVADTRQDGAKVVGQRVLLVLIGVVEGGLDNVVGERVAQQLLELGRRDDLLNQHTTRLVAGDANALLNHVRAELLLGQIDHVVLELVAERLNEGRLLEIEDVLDNVVAERILNKVEGVVADLTDELALLQARSVVDATLEDTAAVPVSADGNAVLSHGVEDELSILRAEVVEALLDDVVAVEVLDQLNNIIAHGVDDHLSLLRGGDELDHLLECACTVLVEGDLSHVLHAVTDENSALLIVAVLEQLLAEIVAEGIGHQLGDARVDLLEDHLHVGLVALVKLALQEAASVLVRAERQDLRLEFLEVDAVESGEVVIATLPALLHSIANVRSVRGASGATNSRAWNKGLLLLVRSVGGLLEGRELRLPGVTAVHVHVCEPVRETVHRVRHSVRASAVVARREGRHDGSEGLLKLIVNKARVEGLGACVESGLRLVVIGHVLRCYLDRASYVLVLTIGLFVGVGRAVELAVDGRGVVLVDGRGRRRVGVSGLDGTLERRCNACGRDALQGRDVVGRIGADVVAVCETAGR